MKNNNIQAGIDRMRRFDEILILVRPDQNEVLTGPEVVHHADEFHGELLRRGPFQDREPVALRFFFDLAW